MSTGTRKASPPKFGAKAFDKKKQSVYSPNVSATAIARAKGFFRLCTL
jgi:hypothetical protein